MKKSMRFIALALAFLIACFAFCGCDFIEEARKEQSVLARLHNADINQQSTGKTIPKARKTDAIAI